MKFKIKSKLGRPFWRFGVLLSPDTFTEMDLSSSQLADIKDSCLLPVAKGGALEIEPNPWAAPAAGPAKSTTTKKESSP